ncbi:TetR/AcrR family transcriptional regulator [Pelagibius sp. Alg239-R121]|uniref:TetR/AcrR family transcriptional regulator n=1 Tax=Pelagibius sp. Alg239-R121 TaxID=2993448 RepID=UPI0024A6BD24|nr:TetR/AcrR family transcriptional regulator [Pelagibius sp. Alg239-R121]
MTGLREKQKEQRQKRILEAARQLIRENDYQTVKVEAIAAEADLSAVTVFNYFGSKGGILLALLAESDRHLVEKIDRLVESDFATAFEAVETYSRTIFDHAFSFLDRRTWAHVHSISILEAASSFGRGFMALEQELIRLLFLLLERQKTGSLIVPDCETMIAAQVLYNVHNARFIQFASDTTIEREIMDKLVSRDLKFILDKIRTT